MFACHVMCRRVFKCFLKYLFAETAAGQAGQAGQKHQYRFLLSSFEDDDELEGELELSNMSSRRHSASGENISASAERDDDEEDVGGTPWMAFLTTPASFVLIVCYWTQNWVGFLLLSELPSYLTRQLGFSLKEAGFSSMLPYIAQFLSALVFGYIFQLLEDRFGWKTRSVRQLAMHICFGGSSVCLIACGFVSDGPTALALMVLALSFYGACQSGAAINFLEISPEYSAELNALANMFAGLSGVASPLVVALCTNSYQGVTGWRIVFFLTGLQCLMSSVLWFLYQTSESVSAVNTPRHR